MAHLGQFGSPGTMKLMGMNLWHFETDNPSFSIGYTLYQSIEIAVLPCINDAAHD